MPLKKSELYSSLWQSCDELRGGMDASQYKDYVLVLLFVKYVSDKAASQKNYLLDVPKGGSFADMVALKGDKEIGDKINKIIGKLADANELKGVIDVADFNDADKLGKGKEMVDRLTNLVSIFDSPNLDFSSNRAEGDDLLGDAYEYLMRHFATEAGKSKGQFYTPAEVSRVMAKVVGVGSAKSAGQTIHDPTCGSGSLLLKAHDEAKSRTGLDLALYGQEMDNATKALARMNMILHDCPTAEIWQDNVLASPHFTTGPTALKTFDFVVANPPFSFKAWSNGFDPANDLFHRFTFGAPPQKNGDLAFVLHILTCLKSAGKAAVNLPHGVLFRGGAEAVIRREIVRRGYIKGIIGLPANLFYGTGIPACIIVLDKENAAARKGIFMIDASRAFIKDGNKNRLRAQDIHKIVDAFTRQAEIPRYSRMVSLSEISDPKNDFNLNLPRYIDSTEPEDLQDIDAHLRGGIPQRDVDALESYWQVLPAVRSILFESAGRPGYLQLKAREGIPSPLQGERARERGPSFVQLKQPQTIPAPQSQRDCVTQPRVAKNELPWVEGQNAPNPERVLSNSNGTLTGIKSAIFGHPEFTTYNDSMTRLFAKWKAANTPLLKGLAKGGKPKSLIETLSEDLLSTFEKAKLLDPYDVYQHLMDYWAETMQDDVYMIVSDGWSEAAKPRLIIEDKNKKTKDKPDFTVGKLKYKAELIPTTLVIARYFPADQAAIEKLEAEVSSLEQAIEEMAEEHGGEEGLLAEALTEKGKLTAKSIYDRLKAIKIPSPGGEGQGEGGRSSGSSEFRNERPLLGQALTLIEKGAATSAKLRSAQDALIAKVASQYGKLTEDEIKILVVDDKWLATLAAAVQRELDRVSQTLTGRIRQLAERYAAPLPQLTDDIAALAARVDAHLNKMGATWKL